MNIPSFFPGNARTRGSTLKRGHDYERSLADRAEKAWHDMGYTSVRFFVNLVPGSHKKNGNYVYEIRSNLVDGLPKGETDG